MCRVKREHVTPVTCEERVPSSRVSQCDGGGMCASRDGDILWLPAGYQGQDYERMGHASIWK